MSTSPERIPDNNARSTEQLVNQLTDGELILALWRDPRYGTEFLQDILPPGATSLRFSTGETPAEPLPELLLAGKLRDIEVSRAFRRAAGELKDVDEAPAIEMAIGELIADQGKHITKWDSDEPPADEDERIVTIWRDRQTGRIIIARHTFGRVRQATFDDFRATHDTDIVGHKVVVSSTAEGNRGNDVLRRIASVVMTRVVPSGFLSSADRGSDGEPVIDGMAVTAISLIEDAATVGLFDFEDLEL